MPMSHGYRQLKSWSWSSDSTDRLAAHHPILAASWGKRALKPVRDEAKAWLIKAQRYRCHYCRCPIEDNLGYLELDHVVPKSLAPQFCYDPLNLVLSCKRCNNAKLSHNTTTLSEAALVTRSKLPFGKTLYKWIHPQLHTYSDHISIRGDALYEGRDAIGTSVIEICKLEKVTQVLARRRLAAVSSSSTDKTAAFKLLGLGPHMTPRQLATQLARARRYPQSKIEKLEQMFNDLRSKGRRVSAARSLDKV